MKKLIISAVLLASFTAHAGTKSTTITTLECDGGYTGSITEINSIKRGVKNETIVLIKHYANNKLNIVSDFDTTDDVFGYVTLNDINQTSVESAMLMGSHDGTLYNVAFTTDINSKTTGSIRVMYEGKNTTFICRTTQTVSGI